MSVGQREGGEDILTNVLINPPCEAPFTSPNINMLLLAVDFSSFCLSAS